MLRAIGVHGLFIRFFVRLVLPGIFVAVIAVLVMVTRRTQAAPPPRRFCSKCGAPSAESARFCPGCGSAIP
jgi:zinc-ribbon domain